MYGMEYLYMRVYGIFIYMVVVGKLESNIIWSLKKKKKMGVRDECFYVEIIVEDIGVGKIC